MSADATAVADRIRDGSNELVTTHVHHVVGEECSDDAVRTVCGYYLYAHQYDDRQAFDETYTTATQICHHCLDEIRTEVETEVER
jgi:hypothetical protein